MLLHDTSSFPLGMQPPITTSAANNAFSTTYSINALRALPTNSKLKPLKRRSSPKRSLKRSF